jgi:hypothetical protein
MTPYVMNTGVGESQKGEILLPLLHKVVFFPSTIFPCKQIPKTKIQFPKIDNGT